MERELSRFLKAQEKDFVHALSEIKSGRKRSHWMWYIFPQIQGLGFSKTAKYYAIEDLDEAQRYLQHKILGSRLREITAELLMLDQNNASEIFGSPDDLKLQSSMTLFASVDISEEKPFNKVLDKFYNGHFDQKTLNITKIIRNVEFEKVSKKLK
ncbi:MAG: DUF1810 domain-containing protein [Bacteroidota bacterium]|nr:DUF1810 domain-containing protein [Bacteroidota bacterium]